MKDQVRVEDLIAAFFILIFGELLYAIWFVDWFRRFINPRSDATADIFQGLLTLFAIVLSIHLVALQLSAQAYSPRSIGIHTRSPYFVGLWLAYLVPILLMLFLMAGGLDLPTGTKEKLLKSSLVLAGFAIVYLVPFSWRTIRLLSPTSLLEELLEQTPAGKLGTNQEDVSRELQPVFDILKRSIREADHYTGKAGLRLVVKRLGRLIREAKSEEEATGIVLALAEPFEDLGFFSNQADNIEMSKEVFTGLAELIRCFSQSAFPSRARLFYGIIEKLDGDTTRRFEKVLHQEKLDEIKEAVASCRTIMARFMA